MHNSINFNNSPVCYIDEKESYADIHVRYPMFGEDSDSWYFPCFADGKEIRIVPATKETVVKGVWGVHYA